MKFLPANGACQNSFPNHNHNSFWFAAKLLRERAVLLSFQTRHQSHITAIKLLLKPGASRGVKHKGILANLVDNKEMKKPLLVMVISDGEGNIQ